MPHFANARISERSVLPLKEAKLWYKMHDTTTGTPRAGLLTRASSKGRAQNAAGAASDPVRQNA
eukprot:1797472-Pleurochrysis_carterae.AAC.1